MTESLSAQDDIEYVIRTQAPDGRKPNEKVNARVVRYVVPGRLAILEQESDLLCWATTATMMVSWKEQEEHRVASVVARAGEKYDRLLSRGAGLDPADKPAFLRSLSLRSEPPQNPTINGWRDLLQESGPLWVTTQDQGNHPFSVHARIIYGIVGDGSIDGTMFLIVDPEGGRSYRESIHDFTRRLEHIARRVLRDRRKGSPVDLAPQIIHF